MSLQNISPEQHSHPRGQKLTAQELSKHLTALGINKGDTVLVRAGLRRIGRMENSGATILEALRDAVGPQGTLMALSFTKSFFLPKVDKDYIFSTDTPPITGALAKLFVNAEDSVRSLHPTNSFVAIGKNAELLLSEHNQSQSCYYPIKKLLEVDGKMILIGCVDASPGFTTVHWAQHELGLAYKNLFKNFYGVYYKDSEEKKQLFRKKDQGGCSTGFYKFYADYVKNEKLTTGYVGDAYSLCIKAKEAYTIEFEVLKNNPSYALCDNPRCSECRGRWLFNKREMLSYYPKLLYNKTLGKLLRQET